MIGHLQNGDTIALAKLNAAFPTDTDTEIGIEVSQFERIDAAIHAPSVLALNGRSLDSHNPWHLDHAYGGVSSSEACPDIPELYTPPVTSAEKVPAHASAVPREVDQSHIKRTEWITFDPDAYHTAASSDYAEAPPFKHQTPSLYEMLNMPPGKCDLQDKEEIGCAPTAYIGSEGRNPNSMRRQFDLLTA